MKKSHTLFVVTLLAAAVVGCATTPLDHTSGTEIAQAKLATFTKGMTTREDVAASVGQPPDKKEVMGKEVWTYPFTRIAAMPFGKNTSESTVFEFDKSGKLISAYKSGAVPGKSGNALLEAAGM
jgi:outer membrane protein assembly factor BamE